MRKEIQSLELLCKDAYFNVDSNANNNIINIKPQHQLPSPFKNELLLYQSTADHNCLFNSISFILFGSEEFNKHLRVLLLNHIFDNWLLFKENCMAVFNKPLSTLNTSIIKLSHVNGWGIDDHIFMFSEILERPIFTYDFTLRHSSNQLQSVAQHKMQDKRSRYFCSNELFNNREPLYIQITSFHYSPMLRKSISQPITTITMSESYCPFGDISHKYKLKERTKRRTKVIDKTSEHLPIPKSENMEVVHEVDNNRPTMLITKGEFQRASIITNAMYLKGVDMLSTLFHKVTIL